MQLVCPSKITQVTVHARGAVVTRLVSVPAVPAAERTDGADADAEIDLVIEQITPLAEPGSVRAALLAAPATAGIVAPAGSTAGGRQIVSIQSSLTVPETPAASGASTARVRELSARIVRLQAEVERLQDRRQKLGKLTPDPALRTTSLAERVDTRIADALATAQLAYTIQTEIDQRLRELEREIAEVQILHNAAELEHSQLPSGARAGSGHPTRRVTVRLAGSGPLQALELSYVVPAARFWPVYTLRMVEGPEGKRRATWLIEALVAQLSGEDWRDVRLGLSTADLSYDARLPELPSLRFGRAQPPARRGYRPPPAGLDALFAGYDRVFSPPGGATSPPQLEVPDADEEAERLMLSNSALEITVPGAEADSFDDIPTSSYGEARRQTGGHPAVKASKKGGPGKARAMADRSDATPREDSMMFSLAAAPAPGGAMPKPAMPPPPPSPSMMPSMAPSVGASFDGAMQSRAAAPKRGGFALGGGGGAREMVKDSFEEGGFGGGIPAEPEPGPSSLEPQDNWLEFDRLVMSGVEAVGHRGRLTLRRERGGTSLRRRATERIESLAPPGGVRDPQDTRGRFDHRFDAEGLVLVPSDGQPHRVSLLSAETTPVLRLLTVPRERPEVYREAELRNPCEAPLLAGPVDVYVEGSLLTTAAIEHIDRGGTLRVGMGVEERVRVARNVRAEEETTGLLGGSTMMTHTVSIELVSSLGQALSVEVQDRLPVSDDKSVTIEPIAARPEAASYTQSDRGAPIRGGMLWRLLLPAGGKAKIDYQYRVTFPGKTEIVGGNRRD